MVGAAVRRTDRHRTAVLIATLSAIACGESGSRDVGGRVSVAATMTRAAAGVVVRGVDERALERLARLAPNDSMWTVVVGVYVESSGDKTAGAAEAGPTTPPVI